MNNFKVGWYENTAENQEALFELGYEWLFRGKNTSFLQPPYLCTRTDGILKYSNVNNHDNIPKGTQINIKPLTVERIQEAMDTLEEMKGLDESVCLTGTSCVRLYSRNDFVTVQTWMDKFLLRKSSERLKLEEVISDLEKSLSDAKAKLEEV